MAGGGVRACVCTCLRAGVPACVPACVRSFVRAFVRARVCGGGCVRVGGCVLVVCVEF